MNTRSGLFFLILTGLLRAQAPVVEARGVVNGVTFELAPSTVAPGGIFNVYGFNLAPGTPVASAVPLPLSLGSPAVEVTVNGRPASLYFVSPTQINAQGGAVTVVPNPDGVQALGAPAAGGGQAQARVVFERNQHANTILPAAFAGAQPVGLVLVEAP